MIEKHVTNVEDSKRLEPYAKYLPKPLFWYDYENALLKSVIVCNEKYGAYLASQLIEALPDIVVPLNYSTTPIIAEDYKLAISKCKCKDGIQKYLVEYLMVIINSINNLLRNKEK